MDQTTDFAYLYEKRGAMKPGLQRVRAAARSLGLDLQKKPRVLIAGTNGKGSTAGFLWQIIRSDGIRTGLFTSPHLRNFRERFQIDSTSVENGFLEQVLGEMKGRLDADLWSELSFFELGTLLALTTFDRQTTAVDIFEVGLGGRLDSTNICEAAGSVIVSIGEDHQEFLGNSLVNIAAEKAGVIKSGRPVYWGESEDSQTGAVIRAKAESLGAPLHCAGRDFGLTKDRSEYFLSPASDLKPLPTIIHRMPEYLQHNWVLAAKVAFDLFDLSVAEYWQPEAVPNSLRGRFEYLKVSSQTCLVDCCHNLPGVKAFVKALQGQPKRPMLVSMLRDKDYPAMVNELQKVGSPIYAFSTADQRSWRRRDVTSLNGNISWHENFNQALQLQSTQSPSPIVLICGSLRAIGQAIEFTGSETHHNQ